MNTIFYDGECPMCNRAVRFVMAKDKHKKFEFSPLEGELAAKKLKDLRLNHPNLDSLVLSYEGKIFIEGRALLRILWILGGKYALLGWLSFLPSFLFDCIYRVIAKYRFRLFKSN